MHGSFRIPLGPLVVFKNILQVFFSSVSFSMLYSFCNFFCSSTYIFLDSNAASPTRVLSDLLMGTSTMDRWAAILSTLTVFAYLLLIWFASRFRNLCSLSDESLLILKLAPLLSLSSWSYESPRLLLKLDELPFFYVLAPELLLFYEPNLLILEVEFACLNISFLLCLVYPHALTAALWFGLGINWSNLLFILL